MHTLAPVAAHILGDAYPDIRSRAGVAAAVIAAEEEAFQRTLAQGLKLVDDMTRVKGGGVISGADAFKLYDSLGFPADLTCLVAKQVMWWMDGGSDVMDGFCGGCCCGSCCGGCGGIGGASNFDGPLIRLQAGWGVDMQASVCVRARMCMHLCMCMCACVRASAHACGCVMLWKGPGF